MLFFERLKDGGSLRGWMYEGSWIMKTLDI